MDAKHTPNEKLRHPPPRVGREYLELWMSLSRREWGSLVLIPADREGSTAEIANALADVGQRLSYEPVTAITVSSLEYGSALALADLQQHLNRERRNPVDAVISGTADTGPVTEGTTAATGGGSFDARGSTPEPGTSAAGARRAAPATTEALAVVPPARLIISVPPVVTEPLGLAAAHEADAVVLVVRMNRACMAEVRRTVELVGRDQVMGCFIQR